MTLAKMVAAAAFFREMVDTQEHALALFDEEGHGDVVAFSGHLKVAIAVLDEARPDARPRGDAMTLSEARAAYDAQHGTPEEVRRDILRVWRRDARGYDRIIAVEYLLEGDEIPTADELATFTRMMEA